MIHPNQYQVNETWVVFQLNEAPVMTDADGDFNVFALMDAASCFILSNEFLPISSEDFSQLDATRFLKSGYSHKKQYPKQLIVPVNLVAKVLSKEAERCGISIVRVPEEDLQLLIGEARQSFQEHISQGRIH